MNDHLWRQINRILDNLEASAVELRGKRQRLTIDANRHETLADYKVVDDITRQIGDRESRASAVRLMVEKDLQDLFNRALGEAYGHRPR